MFTLTKKIAFPNRQNDVLTIGELLIDMISTDYETCRQYQKHFGGSPANIAMNVKSLGVKSLVCTAVGLDHLGEFLVEKLASAGIDTDYVQRVDKSTSMVLVTKSQGSPIPIFYRDADYHLSYTSKLEKAVTNSKIIHFSCWAISMQPVRQTIEQVIKVAKKNQALICFDPNYHPMIWQKDDDAITYIRSLMARVDVVKPSEDDAERLFGKDTPEKQIHKFLDLGAKLVIMTLGKGGLIASNGIETIRYESLATEVVDTTGAGDAFWSGFYTAIIKGYILKDAIKLGNAVSAYKLKYLGAVANLPKLVEIKEIYEVNLECQ